MRGQTGAFVGAWLGPLRASIIEARRGRYGEARRGEAGLGGAWHGRAGVARRGAVGRGWAW